MACSGVRVGSVRFGSREATLRRTKTRLAGGVRVVDAPQHVGEGRAVLGGATACYPGLPGLALLAPGWATRSERGAEPLRAQWEAAVRPSRAA